MKIHSLYDRPADEGISFEGTEEITQQHFAAEADINTIMARYQRTGILVDPLNPGTRKPQYGDFGSVMEYQESMNIIIAAQEAFDDLPATVRKRFNNDPAEMLAFLEDDSNRDEAIRLGFIDKAEEKTEPAIAGE